jgi:hypothetical protein
VGTIRIKLLLPLALLAAPLWAQKPDKLRERALTNFKKDISFLAADALEGRLTGWPGEMLSADYIAKEFAALGLSPKGDNNSWMQPFDIVRLRIAGGKTALSCSTDGAITNLPLNVAFYPLTQSANEGKVNAPLVFLNYGIEADTLGHNDYREAGDLKGKIALIMLGSPKETTPRSPFTPYEELDYKIQAAEKRGVAAIIFIPSPDTRANPDGELKRGTATRPIPIMYAYREVEALKNAKEADLALDITVLKGEGHNVLGYKANKKARYTVIIGAHHDHLGYGELGGSRSTVSNQIHNGADDNASGTAAMLELARIISKSKKYKSYNYLFMAFSGEELGLIGSKYFTRNPSINIKEVAYMVNIDMLGRLDSVRKTLVVNGTGTSPDWKKSLDALPTDTHVLRITTSESGLGPSDHASFYLEGIPVLHFFTGQHQDYHMPTDDEERINYAGMYESWNYMLQFIAKNQSGGKPEFTKTKDVSPGRSPFKVSLGVMPDYSFPGPGMRLDGVSEGKPAQKAGLQKGDIIMALGDTPVENVEGYMKALSQLQKGQNLVVHYSRPGIDGLQQITVNL